MRLLDLRLRVLRGLRTMRRAAPAFSVTDLDVFRYLRFLRHLGKVMLLVVFGLAWLEVEAVIQCSLAPAWRQGGLFARLAVVMTSLLLCFLIVMLLWSYLATFAADPGLVPPGWQPFDLSPDVEYTAADIHCMADDFLEVIEHCDDPVQRHLLRPRFCKNCQGWKPPRAHHCSVTKRCVMKMDHWCVWVLNCVGLYNYKYFVLFLGYTDAACWLCALALLRPCISFFRTPTTPLRLLLLGFISFVFAAAFALALLAFLGMHLRLAAKNQTTIEAFEKAPVTPWPYDQGTRKNFEEVFGWQKRYWLLPLRPDAERAALRRAYLDWTLPCPTYANA